MMADDPDQPRDADPDRADTARGERLAAAEAREAAREGHPDTPPDPVDRAAAPYPVLRWLSWNRWQVLAAFWVIGTVIAIATDGWSTGKLFYVLMAVLFTTAAAFELRGRRRLAARRAAEHPSGTDAQGPGTA